MHNTWGSGALQLTTSGVPRPYFIQSLMISGRLNHTTPDATAAITQIECLNHKQAGQETVNV
jgi:hypothetical protein